MKNRYIIALIFCLLCFNFDIFSQNSNINNRDERKKGDEEALNKYGFHIDLFMLGTALSIESLMKKNKYIGLSGRINEKEYLVSKPSYYPDVIFSHLGINLYINTQINNYFKYEYGVRWSYISYDYVNCDEFCSTNLLSAYFSFFYGFKHFKIGTRHSVALLKFIGKNNLSPIFVTQPLFLEFSF